MAESYPVHLFIVFGALVAAATTDVWEFTVPNRLTVPLLLGGLLFHAATSGLTGLAGSAWGVLVGLGVTVPFCALGGMGAGDVKLMAAVGAWLGSLLTICLFLVSCLVAAVYALVLVFVYGNAAETLRRCLSLPYRLVTRRRGAAGLVVVESEVAKPDRRQRVVPFAAAMALGFTMLLLWAWSQKIP
ncbi:MAG: A24 family peptidase [Gemmataceae bacterium]